LQATEKCCRTASSTSKRIQIDGRCGRAIATGALAILAAMNQTVALVIGIAVGVAMGLATENLFIGSGVGIALAIALGYRGGRKDK